MCRQKRGRHCSGACKSLPCQQRAEQHGMSYTSLRCNRTYADVLLMDYFEELMKASDRRCGLRTRLSRLKNSAERILKRAKFSLAALHRCTAAASERHAPCLDAGIPQLSDDELPVTGPTCCEESEPLAFKFLLRKGCRSPGLTHSSS